MSKKQRLELTWIGKDERPRPEPRVLIEEPALSYRARSGANGAGIYDNMLIKGDNLLALKALEADYAGKVKCVFIDPPYNTGSAFEQYDDGLEHSLWLSLMRDRLRLIHDILSSDGSLWLAIDDNEAHYCKVLCDEIFGRTNFVCTVVWQSKDTPGNNASEIAQTHNYVLVYKKGSEWRPNLIPRSEKQTATYKNPDRDPRGPWLGTPMTRAEHRDRDVYPLKNDTGREVMPPKGSSWRRPPDEIKRLQSEGRIFWGKNGNAEFPVEKKFLSEVKSGVVPQTWWPYEFAGSTRNASAEMKAVFGGTKNFDTPKPERLIERILQVSTNFGDLVLDSFAGSGTTGAVAHKMGRRWIMVELGEHADTHIVPRMRKVIDGQDLGGVTEATGWGGGGGFRYCRLAPSLLAKDRYGQWIIAKDYQPERLAEAVCKLMGFTYAPSLDAGTYWRHGHSTETDFIFVTTQAMTYEALAKLSDEVGEGRTLLVACRAYSAKDDAFPNITPKKIPLAVLAKCEWGRDDYSLNIDPNVEAASDGPDVPEAEPRASKRGRAKDAAAAQDAAPTLFGEKA